MRSSQAIDESAFAPGATTALLFGLFSVRWLLNWLTGPKALPLDTLMLVMLRNVLLVSSSGNPYV